MSLELVEIIVGTYEEFLLGYKIIKTERCAYGLVQSFATHSHQASIRCVAAKNRFLASGSADESVHLYDMVNRKEAGVLGHHNGTVSCLEFSHNGSHLLSGSEDGSLAVCRTGNWQLEKLWGAAHKGFGVNGLSVHPTGKLALSVGKDATLRTWNMVKGRQAYATKLGNKGGEGRQVTCVQWSPDGQHYAVAISCRVDVYSISTAGVVHSIHMDKRVACICFVNDDDVCVGCEGGELSLHSVSQKTQLTMTQAHQQRVKCVAHLTSEDNGAMWLVTASSDGQLKLWQYEDGELSEMCATSIGCRITCLVVVSINPAVTEEKVMDKEENDIVISGARKKSNELADSPESTQRKKKKKKKEVDKQKNLESSQPLSRSSDVNKSVSSMDCDGDKMLDDERESPKKKRKNSENGSKSYHQNSSTSLMKTKKVIPGQSLDPSNSPKKRKKKMKEARFEED